MVVHPVFIIFGARRGEGQSVGRDGERDGEGGLQKPKTKKKKKRRVEAASAGGWWGQFGEGAQVEQVLRERSPFGAGERHLRRGSSGRGGKGKS